MRLRRIPATALGLGLLLLVFAPAPHGIADDADTPEKKAQRRFVKDLSGLARWARSAKLFGKRDEVYELVLEFDPDHRDARRWLRYRRDEQGAWVQEADYERPKDWQPQRLEAFETRRLKVLHAHRDRILALSRGAAAAADPEATARRELALLDLLPGDEQVVFFLKTSAVAWLGVLEEAGSIQAESVREILRTHFPDDAEVRVRVGDVRHGKRWVMREARDALVRREALVNAALEMREAVEVKSDGELTTEEAEVAIEWVGPYETDHMRVLGTAKAETLEQIARDTEAAGAFFQLALGAEPVRHEPYTLLVFESTEDWHRFLQDYALLTDAFREHAVKAGVQGIQVAPSLYVVWGVGVPDVQREMSVLATFDSMLHSTFGDRSKKEVRGWMYEGLSRFLTFRLIGIRMSVAVGGRYATGPAPAANRAPLAPESYLASALALYKTGKAPHLRIALGKYLDAFTGSDSVCGYAFANYLVEGREKSAAPYLRLAGKGVIADEACLEVFGATVDAIQARLVRWLGEVTATGE